MIKKCLAICVCLMVVAGVLGQSRSKHVKLPHPVKQPREVVEAYKVCAEFQRLLAADFDFERAFEATFVKDPARRRALVIAESEYPYYGWWSHIDTPALVGIYKDAAQLLILMLPVMYADLEDAQAEAELFPPPIKAIFDRKPSNDRQKLLAEAAQLKRDLADFRAHFNKLAANNSSVAKNVQEYREHLLKRPEPPNRIVKPMTAYSKGRVLRPDEKYYQIDDCAVIREGGEMRIVGYTFFKIRW